jgi:hypothetical protein
VVGLPGSAKIRKRGSPIVDAMARDPIPGKSWFRSTRGKPKGSPREPKIEATA